MTDVIDKSYIGDSIYAEFDPGVGLTLTTNNGYPDDPRNVIIFGGFEIAALLRFLADRITLPKDIKFEPAEE